MSMEIMVYVIFWIVWAAVVRHCLSPKPITEEDNYGISHEVGHTQGATKWEKAEVWTIFACLLIFSVAFFKEVNRIYINSLLEVCEALEKLFLWHGIGSEILICFPLFLVCVWLFSMFYFIFLIPLIIVGIETAIDYAGKLLKKIIVKAL